MDENNKTHKSEKKADDVSDTDLTFETDQEGTATDTTAVITKLRNRLKEAETQKQEYLNGWQRAKADFINTRKRDEESNREFAKFAKSDLVLDIIPVLDSFDIAFSNKTEWEKLPVEWRKGMEGIKSQLLSILGANGLKELNPIGEEFDPAKEETAGFIDTENEVDEHKILQVLQKGYYFQEKLIRPAKVKIGKKRGSE